MATQARRQRVEDFEIHEDVPATEDTEMATDVIPGDDDTITQPMAPEVPEDDDSSDDEQIEAGVAQDMEKLQQAFAGFRNKYRLVKRIGEGTFSTVYKAEDLQYDRYENQWDLDKENDRWTPRKLKRFGSHSSAIDTGLSSPASARHDLPRRKSKFVAIKKIYVTSSPQRILNELDLLHDLRNCQSVCPLITAFRTTDQVVAILPYFRHQDFREYFRDMTVPDMVIYLRCLLEALSAVHSHGILHRDIKPTNFLYDKPTRRGVLVDFGLAERQGVDSKPCLCHEDTQVRRMRLRASISASNGPQNGHPKNDTRGARRANRAGTRGFRAPEVLFKCTEQTPKIDIWSVGVILLTIMSRRFPFFNSADDVDAMIEIATIFGSKKMRLAGQLHGVMFQTNITTISDIGFDLGKIIKWCTGREKSDKFSEDEELAVDFLRRLLDVDPKKRMSADEALAHDFMKSGQEHMDEHLGEDIIGKGRLDDEVELLR